MKNRINKIKKTLQTLFITILWVHLALFVNATECEKDESCDTVILSEPLQEFMVLLEQYKNEIEIFKTDAPDEDEDAALLNLPLQEFMERLIEMSEPIP